jgi:hypothetical protein
MSYIRNPVYMWTGDVEPFDDRDVICVSLPRGKFRSDAGGCDFHRVELLATALVFLSADYPEFVTNAGSNKLQEIKKNAESERYDKWNKREDRLNEIASRNGSSIVSMIRMGLNPDDWAEDLFDGIDTEDGRYED